MVLCCVVLCCVLSVVLCGVVWVKLFVWYFEIFGLASNIDGFLFYDTDHNGMRIVNTS